MRLSPLSTDGNPHTQLPRRLAPSGPCSCGFNIAQEPPPQPLRLPGAQGQLCQEHTVTQPASFVPGHSYLLSADDSNYLSRASHDNSAPCSFLRGRDRPSSQSFPENAGPYGSGFTSTLVGSASHATYPVLAEVEGSIHGLASRTPPHNGDLGLCISPGTLQRSLLAKARHDLRHSAHRRISRQTLPTRVGEGKPTFSLWSERDVEQNVEQKQESIHITWRFSNINIKLFGE